MGKGYAKMLRWLRRLFGGGGDRPTDVGTVATQPEPAVSPAPAWLVGLPRTIVAVDVETTGLTDADRIVSLAAIRLDTRDLATGRFDLAALQTVVNPGRPSHPAAERVHGFSEAVLRMQDSFSSEAGKVRAFIEEGKILVAHNAAFDVSFINRELLGAGELPLLLPVYCTMEGFRRTGATGSAALDALCAHMGIARRGDRHDALEDAWLALMAYLWLHGSPYQSSVPEGFKPFALRTEPQASIDLDDGPPALTPEANRISVLVDAVTLAKREGRLVDAAVMLRAEVERQEAESRATGLGVAPWYYEQLAIIYRKVGLHPEELEILERYERQTKAPGVGPAKLAERLAKLRAHAP